MVLGSTSLKVAMHAPCPVVVLRSAAADGSAGPLAEALLTAGVPVGLATGYSAAELAPPLRGLPVLDKPYQSSDAIEFVRRLIGTNGHLPPDTCV